MARPGVRRTLRSVSNNVNKRASILRFYRAALSVFDNAAGRAARGKTAPRGRGALDAPRRASGLKANPNGGGYFVRSSESATFSKSGGGGGGRGEDRQARSVGGSTRTNREQVN